MTEWRNIPGFDKHYLVSGDGRVFSQYVNRELKLRVSKNDGYVRVSMKSNTYLIHRLVAMAFCKNNNNYKCVNHIDGNKQNNNASNLEWTTQSQNAIHCAYNISGITNAKRRPNKKLIKKLYLSGKYSYSILAKIFDVSRTTIANIIVKKRNDTTILKDFEILENEVVKKIPGHKYYYASNFGRILSKKSGKELSAQIQPNGYAKVDLRENGNRERKYIHRLIMNAFFGESNLIVNHKNENKLDNRLCNLEYITQSENVIKSKKGKLNRNDYIEIYNLKKQGVHREEIARRFNIHKCYVNGICRKIDRGEI